MCFFLEKRYSSNPQDPNETKSDTCSPIGKKTHLPSLRPLSTLCGHFQLANGNNIHQKTSSSTPYYSAHLSCQRMSPWWPWWPIPSVYGVFLNLAFFYAQWFLHTIAWTEFLFEETSMGCLAWKKTQKHLSVQRKSHLLLCQQAKISFTTALDDLFVLEDFQVTQNLRQQDSIVNSQHPELVNTQTRCLTFFYHIKIPGKWWFPHQKGNCSLPRQSLDFTVHNVWFAVATLLILRVPILFVRCSFGDYMGVSKNRGTPKWMVYNGKPY